MVPPQSRFEIYGDRLSRSSNENEKDSIEEGGQNGAIEGHGQPPISSRATRGSSRPRRR